jgi:hypothetical protein
MVTLVSPGYKHSQIAIKGLHPFFTVWRQQFETQDAVTDMKVAYDGKYLLICVPKIR